MLKKLYNKKGEFCIFDSFNIDKIKSLGYIYESKPIEEPKVEKITEVIIEKAIEIKEEPKEELKENKKHKNKKQDIEL